jgi:chaperone modulatory protein CbpM
MNSIPVAPVFHGILVEEQVQFTLIELSRACGVEPHRLVALVEEGVVAVRTTVGIDATTKAPSESGTTMPFAAATSAAHSSPPARPPLSDADTRHWRFDGVSLRRARTALRLNHDLELNAAGVALVLDLLERIDQLESRLRRAAGTPR